MFPRRQFLFTASGALLYAASGRRAYADGKTFSSQLNSELSAIERTSGGRLGVAVLDMATGARAGHRADERFAMCSTFKLLEAAAVLQRVDAGTESLSRRLTFTSKDILEHAPITEEHVGSDGMSLLELCDAAVRYSDSTAANLLLGTIGGPAGFTAFARAIGDNVTRLDRNEPDMSQATPGDPRDTTSPAAMVQNLQTLLLGKLLSDASRAQLEDWMLRNTTGDPCLRAGVPKGWHIGDKTGTGDYGTRNDVAVIRPPQHAPVLVAVYLTGATAITDDQRNAAIADVARAVAAAL
ncbi:MAG TPA: class A beta-lactamase [Acidobacteriaceae bacterium]|nr:class A beta-lactamase [Acidobacteriaceae bacterium]